MNTMQKSHKIYKKNSTEKYIKMPIQLTKLEFVSEMYDCLTYKGTIYNYKNKLKNKKPYNYLNSCKFDKIEIIYD